MAARLEFNADRLDFQQATHARIGNARITIKEYQLTPGSSSIGISRILILTIAIPLSSNDAADTIPMTLTLSDPITKPIIVMDYFAFVQVPSITAEDWL